jgi:hypothetical protein
MKRASETDVRNQFAKLLAKENLLIEHRDVSTATMDLVNRILTLPMWEAMNDDLYTMLTAHEVGHALETPPDAWISAPQTISATDANGARQFLNVVEDARIERLMKCRYPGLRRAFYTAYKELNERDFFNLSGKKINDLALIDRINLHFKIGLFTNINFNQREQQFVDSIELAETFDDVVTITRQIYAYGQQNKQRQKPPGAKNDTKKEDGDKVIEQHDSEGCPSEEEYEKEAIETLMPDEPSGEDDAQTEDESDDVEPDQGEPLDSIDGVDPDDAQTSETDEAFENSKKRLLQHGSDIFYFNIPDIDPSLVIEDWEAVHIRFDPSKLSEKDRANVLSSSQEFRRNTSQVVAFMHNDFERKKAAVAYSRTRTAKTGVIDTNKLHSYRYSDDLFKRNTIVPKGQSHGLVFFLDWSSSMNGSMAATIEQLLTLVLFCRRARIPFEVYAFSDVHRDSRSSLRIKYKHKDLEISKSLRLINWLSSRMTAQQFDVAFKNIWMLHEYFSSNRCKDIAKGMPSDLYTTGTTPLNDSIIVATRLVPEFKRKCNLDIVNTVFLTDGESNFYGRVTSISSASRDSIQIPYDRDWCLRDTQTYSERKITHSDEMTTSLLELLRERTKSKVVGFFLVPMGVNQFRGVQLRYGNLTMERLLEHKFVSCLDVGYDELFLLPGGDAMRTMSDIRNLGTGAQEIVSRFTQEAKERKVSRPMLSRFIDLIA